MKAQILVFLFIGSFIFLSINNIRTTQQPLVNDNYNYIAINEILMWISNNGIGSHDPRYNSSGFYWPGGEEGIKTAVFADGLFWGGKVNGETRANGSQYRAGLQAGKIMQEGIADDPDNPKYRVYRIRKDWEDFPPGSERDALEKDYNEWPVEDGAPWLDVNGDSIYTPNVDRPEFIGDEMLWCVSNDLDTSRTQYTYGSDPIGLEIQNLVWGYNETDFLKDVVFKKYMIINKGFSTVDSMYLAYWAEDDLGYLGDDFVGCDTLLNLGYTYNSDDDDGGGTGSSYGTPPPAVGHLYLQGPVIPGEAADSAQFNGSVKPGYKNLPITASMIYVNATVEFGDPPYGLYQGTLELYNNLRGLHKNGNPLIDPHTGSVTQFAVPGDPVTGEGWYEGEGWPDGYKSGNRDYLISSGPFTLAPGDSQEIIIAIFMAIGEDNIDSITKLKEKAIKIHQFFGHELPTNIAHKDLIFSKAFRLKQNYPNPFNPTTTIEFFLPISESVTIEVFNIAGQKVKTLVNGKMNAGKQSIEFNARNLASGIYFYQIQAGSFCDVKKMVVIK